MQTALCLIALMGTAFAQSGGKVQSFPLKDAQGLIAQQVKVESAEYLGRKAVRLTMSKEGEGFAMLPGTDFQDGTIEADFALKINAPPGMRMPGFVGIAFRARDASHFELFYVRPGNSQASDQAMRNHSVQYVASPDFGWYRLRREWPFIYETYSNLRPETWTHLKIEVAGRAAKFYLNGAAEPSLVVDGLKGEDSHGAVGLWGYPNQEAYFSDVRITAATAQPIQNGGDATGTWQVKMNSDGGSFEGTLRLNREAGKLSGTWSGAFGDGLPVTGAWRDGYIQVSFDANWTKEAATGRQGKGMATLAGWIDGDAAKGRMKVEKLADGSWTATRKP